VRVGKVGICTLVCLRSSFHLGTLYVISVVDVYNEFYHVLLLLLRLLYIAEVEDRVRLRLCENGDLGPPLGTSADTDLYLTVSTIKYMYYVVL